MPSILSKLFKNRYLVSLGTGYAQMGLQILVSLAQVPLCLAYLGKEQFGIWVLAAQAAMWLQLLDGGMNGALSRYLIDFRKQEDPSNLRNCLATGFRILLLQGTLVCVLSFAMGNYGGRLFHLSANHANQFAQVMTALGIAAAIGFAGKIFTSWLYASQRLDLANGISLFLTPIEFAIVWYLLHQNMGLMALGWARLTVTILSVLASACVTIRWLSFPWRMLKSRLDVSMLRLLATFGGGMFLLTLGSLLLTMTQTALVAKHLGVAAAAVWATAPKVFLLTQHMLCKIWDYRVPHLSCLMAENKRREISTSFLSLFQIITCLGACACGILAAINPAFLQVWTGGKIAWNAVNDLLIAGSVFIFLITRCITDFVLHTKKVGWMPALMCLEGLIFIVAASYLLPTHGITGMLIASLVINGTLRLPYAWLQLRKYLKEESPKASAIAINSLVYGLLASGIWILLSQINHFKESLSVISIITCQLFLALLISALIVLSLKKKIIQVSS